MPWEKPPEREALPGFGVVGGSNRVKRGGSWNNNANNLQVGNRNNNNPNNENNNIGFRLASTGALDRYRPIHGWSGGIAHVQTPNRPRP